MKKILLLLTTAIILFSFTSVMAVDNIEVSGGVYYFATKGVTPETGYSLKITIPTGIDMKSIKVLNQYRADTTYTLQWLTEGETVFSNYTVNNQITEVESKVLSTYIRKTVGVWHTFIDAGLTYWDIPNSLGGNVNYEGYYVGVGVKPFMDFRTKIGSYMLNQGVGQPKLFIFGLNIGYKF